MTGIDAPNKWRFKRTMFRENRTALDKNNRVYKICVEKDVEMIINILVDRERTFKIAYPINQ